VSRRLLATAVVAAAVAAGIGGYLLVGDEDAGDDRPAAILRTPTSYRIVFRVEDFAGGDTVTIEELLVRRPFEARVETRAGGRLIALDVHAFGRHAIQGEGEGRAVVVAAEPSPPGPDLQPAPALADALERELIERRAQRTVAGRACQVYRAGAPVAGGVITPVDADSDEWADFCVDEAGLVVAEDWVLDGDLVRRRTASTVDERPDISADAFVIDGEVLPVDAGGGAVQLVTDDSRPPDADFWELRDAPAGFDHHGRYVVSPPSGGSLVSPEPGPSQAGVTDVWVRPAGLLVVENGGTVSGEAAFGDHPVGRDVDLDDLGTGEVVVDLRSSQVHVNLGGGRYVRVYGTLPPGELVDIARRLERRDGGTITTR